MPGSRLAVSDRPRLAFLVVVEGKTDIVRIQRLFDADCFATNGSAISGQTISDIRALANGRKIVLFTDNDHAGEKIRRILRSFFADALDAFITYPWGKQGQVALAADSAVRQALSGFEVCDRGSESLSFAAYARLRVSAAQRRLLCRQLRISLCNNKQFVKRMNVMQVSEQQIKGILVNAGV